LPRGSGHIGRVNEESDIDPIKHRDMEHKAFMVAMWTSCIVALNRNEYTV